MSRFTGLPADYAPGYVLSARTAPEGGALAAAVSADPAAPLSAARELVVLVHGFNNHMGEGASDYQAFRAHQYPLAGFSAPALEGSLADFFWPGDADMGLLDKLDFMAYPQAVHVAPGAGQRLAAFLATLPNLLTLDFVGHSLGCRVVLECIQQMSLGAHPRVRQVVLMAAAVPLSMVSAGGALAPACAVAQSVLVLHSSADDVLHYTFAPGETEAGGEGLLPIALGRDGPPPGMPGVVQGQDIAGAGHSDYWGVEDDSSTAASRAIHQQVASFVADALKLGSVARTAAPSRAAGAAMLAGYPRLAASPRDIAARAVAQAVRAI